MGRIGTVTTLVEPFFIPYEHHAHPRSDECYISDTLRVGVMMTTVAEQTARKLLDIGEAGQRLGIHQHTRRQWADRGQVKHVRLISGVRRFDLEEIERVRPDMGLEPVERDAEG